MQRLRSLDLARGFTVLFIAPIHAVLLFSKPEVYNTCFGQFLAFIAEGPGGQLFMLLMGISFVLSKHTDFSSVIKKVLLLLLAGYALNFLKFVLPAMLNIIPPDMYSALDVHRNIKGLLQMLLTGDILQFAGIALLVIYLVSRLPHYPLWAAVLAVTICFISPALYDLHNTNIFYNEFLQLLGGNPPRVFFPLMPWLVYPLVGLIMGYYIKLGKPLIFGYAMIIGFLLMLFSCSYWMPYASKINVSFYRTYPPGTFYHLGIVLVWLYPAHWIVKHNPHRLLLKFFSFLSRHITLIYFVQWIMICWALPFVGFRTLGLFASVIASTIAGIVAILIPCIILVIKSNKINRKT